MQREKLSLIIPCYNEKKTLAACVERCLVLDGADLSLELIIVDDCSMDGSLRVAQELAVRHDCVRVLHHSVNKGKGAALRTGFQHATGNYVGIQDADMEYEPLDYKVLLMPLQEGKADVVYGSRYLRPDTRRVLYFWHTWMNRTLTFVSNMFTNMDISDMETCYKLFRRDMLQKFIPLLREDRFGFEPEITSYVSQQRCRVYECAIRYTPRSYEEGKKIDWKDGVRALYCILHYGAHCAALPMQILLYFFIGGVCALANILMFSLAHSTGMGTLAAVWLAFALAAALNYGLCVAILFRHKARWSSGGELLAYLAATVVMGWLDYAITAGLMSVSLSPMWSKTWSTLVGFAGNFLLRKYLVFPESKNPRA